MSIAVDYWDGQARLPDGPLVSDDGAEREQDWLAAIFPDGIPDGRLLDLGCGVGRLTAAVPGAVGVDLSWEMLQRARPGPAYCQIDGALPFADESFVMVWSVLVLQHCPPSVVRRYLGETARVLTPGGLFRFQYVRHEGGSLPVRRKGPFAWDYAYRWMNTNMPAAGFHDWYCQHGGIIHDQWSWMTARKGL